MVRSTLSAIESHTRQIETTETVRYAVIGLGWWATEMALPALTAADNATVTTLVAEENIPVNNIISSTQHHHHHHQEMNPINQPTTASSIPMYMMRCISQHQTLHTYHTLGLRLLKRKQCYVKSRLRRTLSVEINSEPIVNRQMSH
jgi:K+ transporter